MVIMPMVEVSPHAVLHYSPSTTVPVTRGNSTWYSTIHCKCGSLSFVPCSLFSGLPSMSPLARQQKPCGDMVTVLHDNMSSKSNDNMSSDGIFFWGEVDKHIPPKRQLLRWTITSESASNTISSKILGANIVVRIVCYVFLWTLHHFDWCRNASKNAEVVRF